MAYCIVEEPLQHSQLPKITAGFAEKELAELYLKLSGFKQDEEIPHRWWRECLMAKIIKEEQPFMMIKESECTYAGSHNIENINVELQRILTQDP